MQMHEVTTPKDKKDFLALPLRIYKNDPNWIRPLDRDIEAIFDPTINKTFKHGVCERWLLKDEQGAVMGRIAAFTNTKFKFEQATGGIGFFECIDDQKVANFMFDHCQNWLKKHDIEAMDGPINFGERDRWWGLQIEGFQPPLYCMNYNPPYYQKLFEKYGFKVFFYQLCFAMKTSQSLQEKFFESHARLKKDNSYVAKRIETSKLEKYAADFTLIYNKAFAVHGDGKVLDVRTAQKMFTSMKPIIDENLVWFAYKNDEPIAFWINLPDINQYFKKMNGRFGWFQKLYFLWLQLFSTCNRFVGLVFGIVPEYHGKGVDGFLIVEAAKVIQHLKKYDDFELQWVGDFNPKMISIAESLGTHCSRKLATYRYLFDQSAKFERHPIL